jgi:subtilisin family serine protease
VIYRLLVWLLVCATLAVSATLAGSPPPATAAQTPPWTGALLVGLQPAAATDLAIPSRAASSLFSPDATVTPIGGATYRLVPAPAADAGATAGRLLLDQRVRYVEPDYELTRLADEEIGPFAVVPNDPGWLRQEEMRLVEANRAWEVTTGAQQTIIAVLDTGILATHADLAGKVLPGYDFLANKPGAVDDEGHGTFTAGIAAAIGNNKTGIAGVCWSCQIMPLKILNEEGRGPTSAFVRAIRYAIDNGARVVNVSAGGPNYSQAMGDAIAYAVSKNVLVVAAAGNTPEERANYPAAIESVMAVASIGPNDSVTDFSSFGAYVDIAAPGVDILSAYIGGNERLIRATGTSASAPFVSGAAALLVSVRPDLSAAAITELLTYTAVDIGTPGRDDHFGAGRLSVYDAALAAVRPGPNGPVTTEITPASDNRFRIVAGGFAGKEKLRIWSTSPEGRIHVYRGLAADDAGNLDTIIALPPDASAGLHHLTTFGDQSHRVAVASLNATLPPANAFFKPLPPQDYGPGRLYFPETGHTLNGGFRAFWEENGGLAVFGFPISEEFREVNASDGRTYTVQYFERNRFEYHPENKGTPYEVQLGLLGSQLTAGRTFPPGPPTPSSADARYFPATGHTLSGDFLTYWESHGGLAIFGYPISEPLTEDGRTVQYFERNRFELHPELPLEYRVSLGLLGAELARRNGYLSTPTS